MSTSAPAKCRTLVVEDDPQSAEMMSRILTMVGHETVVARTVSEALDALERVGAECLLLDLQLPDGTGVDVLRRIREKRLPVRVAVVTAGFDDVLVRQALDLKPDALFEKPLDANRITRWLQSVDAQPQGTTGGGPGG